ncbi:hypothetical protein IV203_021681 [Nitzschia inconspicua]|uniref:Uncharacterized protein n=1 Tax=Nitzschia inconspicua TaxID=303405 RepID=A0A9K3KH72_9STRA|nr:hypothetical protein IV203_022766 [Nitzschia inconspicua]KAG7343673.1 hypothetical protein IV203_021681 [Nitzschia inconspicua]
MSGTAATTTTIEDALALVPHGIFSSDVATAATKIRNGEVLNALVTSLTERELAAGFVYLTTVPMEDVEHIFLQSEGKEEADETVQQIVRMQDDGSLDFSSVQFLPAKSARDTMNAYLNCTPGDTLNLSKEEMEMFHALDKKHATQEQVQDVLKKVLQQRLDAYQQQGLEGIAPYQRKNGKDFYPGKELRERTQQLWTAAKVAPDFIKYMLDYPNHKPTAGEIKDVFGWINFNIDDKPTISMFHKSFYKVNDTCAAMCFRHFYVSQGHNSVQNVGGAFPVPEGTLLLFASRTSTDLVAGFGGNAKKVIGSRIMGGKIKANFERYRKKLQDKYEK